MNRLDRRLAPHALSLVALAAPPLAAQTQLHQFDGEHFSDLFGMAVAGGGDVNADGFPDVLASGYRGAYNGGFSGVVRVFSGQDGALLLDIPGAQGETLGSAADFAGDVDGDGADDLVVSSLGDAPRILSGAGGGVLVTLPTGNNATFSVEGAGDRDGDGLADVLSGNSLRSGLTGALILGFPAAEAFSLAGDVDGDGVGDVIGMDAFTSPYEVRVYSGADASLLHLISVGHEFKFAVGVGDVDGDGADDFAIDTSSQTAQTIGVDVHSGANGALLYALPQLGNPGVTVPLRTLAGAGDVDGDGRADFLTGGDPSAALVSGATGCVLATFSGVDVQGYAVAAAGDVDLDGAPDFVLGDPLFHGPSVAGVAGVFRYDGPLGASFCTSTPNSTGAAAAIGATGSLSVAANALALYAQHVPAGQTGVFYYGPLQTQVPFGNGFRCVAAGGLGLFRLPVQVAGGAGCLEHTLDYGAPPAPAGQISAGSTWSFQAWFRDPAGGGAGFDLSDGLELTFGP